MSDAKQSGSEARGTRRIEVSFDRWEDLLASRLDLDPAGLFVAGRWPLAVGDPVVVRCRVPGDDDPVRLSARVLWRRLARGNDPSLRAGLGLVLRGAALPAWRRILQRAEGTLRGFARQEERFPTRSAVRCTFDRPRPVTGPAELTDVSPRGAGLRTRHRPAIDDPVEVLLELAGSHRARGTVRWVRLGPREPDALSQVGLRLEFTDDNDRLAWERLVEQARSRERIETEAAGT